jgi:hypothetical protein
MGHPIPTLHVVIRIMLRRGVVSSNVPGTPPAPLAPCRSVLCPSAPGSPVFLLRPPPLTIFLSTLIPSPHRVTWWRPRHLPPLFQTVSDHSNPSRAGSCAGLIYFCEILLNIFLENEFTNKVTCRAVHFWWRLIKHFFRKQIHQKRFRGENLFFFIMEVKQKRWLLWLLRWRHLQRSPAKHAFILHYSFFVSCFFSKTYSIRILIVDVVNFLFNVWSSVLLKNNKIIIFLWFHLSLKKLKM